MSKKAVIAKKYKMKVDLGEFGKKIFYRDNNNKKELLESYELNDGLIKAINIDDIEDLGEVELYRIASCKPQGRINILINFREQEGKPYFYDRYATYEEIARLLEDDYVVAVKGLGEIDSIEDVK